MTRGEVWWADLPGIVHMPGYQDRIGVFEVMQVTEEIRALLVEGLSRLGK